MEFYAVSRKDVFFSFSFSLNLFLSIVITNSNLIPILRTRHDNTIRKSTNIATTLSYSLILSAQKLKIRTEKLDPSRFLSTPSLARVSTVRQFFEAYGSTTRRKVTDPKREVCRENFINSGFVWVPHVAASVEHRSAPPILYSVVGRERISNRRERGREGERSN